MQNKIREICNKTPKIMAMFLKFHEQGDYFDEYTLIATYSLIIKHKKKLSLSGVNYLQIPSFNDLKSTIELITLDKFEITKKKSWLVNSLKDDNISFYTDGNDIQFEIDTYEQMQKYGSETWCIYKSLKFFNKYKKNSNSFYIISKFKVDDKVDSFGLTMSPSGKLLSAFNSENRTIYREPFFIAKNNTKLNDQSHLVCNNKNKNLMFMATIISILYNIVLLNFIAKKDPDGLWAAIGFSAIVFPLIFIMAYIYSLILSLPLVGFRNYILFDTKIKISKYFNIFIMGLFTSSLIWVANLINALATV